MRTVQINLDKAKGIKQDMVRKERQALFEKLDVMWMVAFERNQTQKMQEVALLKEVLRNAPQASELLQATDVSSLLQVDPLKQVREFLNG